MQEGRGRCKASRVVSLRKRRGGFFGWRPAGRETNLRAMTTDESWKLERDAFLAMSPPRQVPQSMSRAVVSFKSQWLLMIFGMIFLLMGLGFSWAFVPRHLLRERKLEQGPSLTVPGKILSVEETNLSINEVKVREYQFSYQPDSGGSRQGTAYTTGGRWREGATVRVRYLEADPALAVPEGARLGKSSAGALFVLLFPLVGGGILIGCLYSRQTKKRLLRHGWASSATVTALEKTSTEVNGQHVFKIHLTFIDDGRVVVKRSYDAAELALAEEAVSSSRPLQILYDPNKPKRLLFPETWKS
jgi:hypothetical protein